MSEPDWLPRARELHERKWTYARIAADVAQSRSVVYYWLRRKTGAVDRVTRSCAGCGVEFSAYDTRQRYHSRACWAEHAEQTATGARPATRERLSSERQGAGNPNFRHGRRAGQRDREGERRWYTGGALLGERCAHPGCRGAVGVFALHHVIYRQEVRRRVGDVWDPTNALVLCDGCHSSHHRRGDRVVPLAALRDETYTFAVALMGAPAAYEYLRRRYAGDDPRLERLLEAEYGQED